MKKSCNFYKGFPNQEDETKEEQRLKVLVLAENCTYVVFHYTTEQVCGETKWNAAKTIQIVIGFSQDCCQWEIVIVPCITKTSNTYDTYSGVIKEIFRKAPLFTDAKLIIGRLYQQGLIGLHEMRDYEFNDVCLARWLINSDDNSKAEISSSATNGHAASVLFKDLHSRWKAYKEDLQDRRLMPVYKLELAVLPILIEMESKGLNIDKSEFERLDRVLSAEIKLLEKKCADATGTPICVNSHVQLRQVLFDQLKLHEKLPCSTQYKTAKSSDISTSEAVLAQLIPHHPLPKYILEYRQISKVHSTFITGLRPFIHNSVLRPSWEQTSAATGRIQSSKPNIQAIPKASITCAGDAGSIRYVFPRSFFQARDGYTFISVDFKQIEFRIFAHMTAAKKLTEAFADDAEDIFKRLSYIWLKKAEENNIESREKTKTLVYSLMYGAGKRRLSQSLSITPMEAQCVISRFLKEFPEINKYSQSVIYKCRESGYCKSIMGRIRKLPGINDNSFAVRAQCERQAVNFTIQGSAADICKIAMKQLYRRIIESDIDASILVQIHDELLLEVEDESLEIMKEICIQCMETKGGIWFEDLELKVPLRIAIKVGKNWAYLSDQNQ